MDRTRRRFVAGAGTLATVGVAGLAGCAGILDDGDESEDDGASGNGGNGEGTNGGDGSSTDGGDTGGGGEGSPKAALRSYVTAGIEGNLGEADARVHPDGSADGYTQQETNGLQQSDASVESISVVERGDGRATLSLTMATSFGGDGGEITNEFELRTHEGEWMIWSEPS